MIADLVLWCVYVMCQARAVWMLRDCSCYCTSLVFVMLFYVVLRFDFNFCRTYVLKISVPRRCEAGKISRLFLFDPCALSLKYYACSSYLHHLFIGLCPYIRSVVDTRALAQGSENNVFHSRANWRIVSLTFKRPVLKQTRCSLQMSRDNIAQLARASCRNRCSGCIGRGLVVSKRAHVAPGLSRSGHEIKAKQAKS